MCELGVYASVVLKREEAWVVLLAVESDRVIGCFDRLPKRNDLLHTMSSLKCFDSTLNFVLVK